MPHILLTGAAGFIGFHTTKRLLEQGYDVYGIDNINDYYDPALKLKRLENCGIPSGEIHEHNVVESNILPGYRFQKMDITDSRSVRDLFSAHGFDYVIHLAAQPGARYSVDHPDTYIESNIIGFMSILEACRHHTPRHLVYASSSSIYGDNKKTPYHEDDITDFPASLYGATKKSNELLAYAYSHLYKIPATGLRFFTVYGPWGRPDMAYFKYTEAILSGKPVDVFNFGKLYRDFTYIDDIVKGVVDLMKIIPGKEPRHQVFNIGNSKPVELLRFIEILEKVIDKKAEKNMLPMQEGDVYETFADTSKLEAYCGYKPYTELETGLKNFIDWYFTVYNKA